MSTPAAVAFDSGQTLAERFRAHAGTQTHLYGHLMRALADDWEGGGPTREICAGYEDAPVGASIQLRLLAGLFRIVLTGRAPELEPFYPSLGGTADPAQAWPVVRPVLAAHVADLHAALAIPPQTNEVGRSAALLVGLFDLVRASGRRRIVLLELGASAGLNLLLPWFRLEGEGWAYGPEGSPVRLVDAVEGPVEPVEFAIISAAGCDPDPVDPTSEAGRLLLTSFVWPFVVPRHERLRGALQIATAHPPRVERGTASQWLPTVLGDRESEGDDGGDDDTLTVVWNSITQMYWPRTESDAVARLLDEYGARRPLGRVVMEYLDLGDRVKRPDVETVLWTPGSPTRVRRLGTAHDHGVPVRLVQDGET